MILAVPVIKKKLNPKKIVRIMKKTLWELKAQTIFTNVCLSAPLAVVGKLAKRGRETLLFPNFPALALEALVDTIDMYRIDKLMTVSTCTSVGTASNACQIHLVADVGIIEI
jgi:hypothetical protein